MKLAKYTTKMDLIKTFKYQNSLLSSFNVIIMALMIEILLISHWTIYVDYWLSLFYAWGNSAQSYQMTCLRSYRTGNSYKIHDLLQKQQQRKTNDFCLQLIIKLWCFTNSWYFYGTGGISWDSQPNNLEISLAPFYRLRKKYPKLKKKKHFSLRYKWQIE